MCRVGEFLSKYTAGKMPKAFKHIPSTQMWEQVLYLTEPEKWTPNAMFQATRIFASNLNAKKAERFYKLVLLPRIRDDIRKNKKLHFALYQALKKSLYKPAAFNKGILFPLCKVCLSIQHLESCYCISIYIIYYSIWTCGRTHMYRVMFMFKIFLFFFPIDVSH